MYAVFGGFQEIVKTLLGLCVLLVGKYVISVLSMLPIWP